MLASDRSWGNTALEYVFACFVHRWPWGFDMAMPFSFKIRLVMLDWRCLQGTRRLNAYLLAVLLLSLSAVTWRSERFKTLTRGEL